jgi:hypothetical protein
MKKRTQVTFAVVVVASLVALGAGRAAAQDAPPVHRNRLGFDLGIASAVGTIGLAYQFAPSPRFRLEGGLGWGFSGVQLSIMPKVALGGAPCVFVVGLGPSLALGGPYADAGAAHEPRPDVIPWLNLDVPGIECRSDAGFSVEATLGLTMALRAFHYDIADTGATIHAGNLLPQGRFGLGWWF